MKINFKMSREKYIVLSCFIMTSLLILRCVNDFFMYIAAVFGFALISFTKLEDSFIFLISLLPYSMIFKFGAGQISVFTLLFLIYACRVFLNEKFSKKFFLSIILLFAYMLCTSGISQIITIGTILCGLVMTFWVSKKEQNDFKLIIYAFSIGIICSSILATFENELPILSYIRDSSASVLFDSENNDLGIRFSGLEDNSNYYAFNIVVVLSCLAILIIKNNRLVDKIIFGVISYFGFLTISKSFLIVWSILIVTLFINQYFIDKKNTVITAIVFVFLGYILQFYLQNEIYMYTSRLINISGQSMSELTTSRSTIWLSYLDTMVNNIKIFILGNGIGNYEIIQGRIRAFHNTYIQLWYSCGVIGTVLFSYGLRKSFFSHKGRTYSNIIYLPLFILAINCFAIDAITYDNFYFFLALIASGRVFCSSNENKIKNN